MANSRYSVSPCCSGTCSFALHILNDCVSVKVEERKDDTPSVTSNPGTNHGPHYSTHRHPQPKRRKHHRPRRLVPHIRTHDPKARRDSHAQAEPRERAKDADGDEVPDEPREEGEEGVPYQTGEVEQAAPEDVCQATREDEAAVR